MLTQVGGQILLVKSQEHMKRARKPNKFKEWKLKQPLWKQFFIEVLMFTLIALAFEPVLNMLGMSMLPWRWF